MVCEVEFVSVLKSDPSIKWIPFVREQDLPLGRNSQERSLRTDVGRLRGADWRHAA